jgi:hypothetical protein
MGFQKMVIIIGRTGEMSEWSIVHAWKACVPKAPRVRIPVSPPPTAYVN